MLNTDGSLKGVWDMLTIDVHNIITIINKCHWAVEVSKKAKGRISARVVDVEMRAKNGVNGIG
jgi:hypothetical protein